MTKKVAGDRFGMMSTLAMNAEAYKGARGGDEEGHTENLSRSTKAIEKIFQA